MTHNTAAAFAVLVIGATLGLTLGPSASAERPSSAIDGHRPPGVSANAGRIVEPIRIFDNLYYVGTSYVSAYLITTGAGLIMIDSLHDGFTEESLAQIEVLGFDLADIRYVIVTHGHRDHFGGAGLIQARSGARVGMAEADWELVERGNAELRRDMVIEDGATLRLGDTELRFYVTPGHTPGVTSILFPVYDEGREHTAFLFGGHEVTGPWPGDSDEGRRALQHMTASTQRLLRELPAVDVNLTSHPWAALIFERARLLEARAPGADHPFVDPADFRAFLGERLGAHRTRLRSLQ